MTQRTPPRWHQSAPRPNPKSRPYAQPAEAPAILTHPGDIIPESWARINRNAGRQLIGTGGRHHLGMDGRLAPESAVVSTGNPDAPVTATRDQKLSDYRKAALSATSD